jgi:hypothetical protein
MYQSIFNHANLHAWPQLKHMPLPLLSVMPLLVWVRPPVELGTVRVLFLLALAFLLPRIVIT